jgi:hypothetical protein
MFLHGWAGLARCASTCTKLHAQRLVRNGICRVGRVIGAFAWAALLVAAMTAAHYRLDLACSRAVAAFKGINLFIIPELLFRVFCHGGGPEVDIRRRFDVLRRHEHNGVQLLCQYSSASHGTDEILRFYAIPILRQCLSGGRSAEGVRCACQFALNSCVLQLQSLKCDTCL